MKKLEWLYLVLAILFSAIGIIQCYRWSRTGIITSFITYLFFFTPAIIFWATFTLKQFTKQKILLNIAIVLCWIVVGIWGFLTIPAEMILPSLTNVTNIKKYEKILNGYWSFHKDLVKHFPSKIDADMKKVKFFFCPAFLQGGACIQLRYTTTDENIAELYKHFSEIKNQTFIGGDCNDHLREADVWTTNFYTNDSESYEFPDDFEIIVIHSEGFNHGESCGVAISKMKKIIVYWAESW